MMIPIEKYADPKFNPEMKAKFAALLQAESDRVNGIKR